MARVRVAEPRTIVTFAGGRRRGGNVARMLALVQGIVYITTGAWSILSRGSFERVTGKKTDYWLVRTVGALVSAIGGVLAMGSRRSEPLGELRLLGAASAAGLAGVDLVYATRGRISKVYLLDAVLELGIAAGWLLAYVRPDFSLKPAR